MLSALWSFARWWDADDPSALWVFPSTATLARLTEQNTRSVWRQLATLTDAGLVVREARVPDGGDRRAGWRLVPLPDPLDSEPEQGLLPGVGEGFDPDLPLVGESLSPDPPVRVATAVALTREADPPDSPVTPPLTGESVIRTNEDPVEEPTMNSGLCPDPQIDDAPSDTSSHVDAVDLSLLVDEVLELMRTAVLSVTGKPGGPRNVETNRKLVRIATKREHATIDDWRAVIDAQVDSVRDHPETWRYLCLSTICRPGNFARLADAPRGRNGRRTRHAPSRFDEPERDEVAGLFADLDADEIPL